MASAVLGYGQAERSKHASNLPLVVIYGSILTDCLVYSDPNPPFVGYLGEIFWDQDMHMLPAMLPLFPDLALAGANWRAAPQRTRAARETARHMGYAGAKIPVETDPDGYGKGWTDGAPYAYEELQTGGCVVIALEAMYRATGDMKWLGTAAPAVIAIAEFFASRMVACEHNSTMFCLNDVMGSDEFYARKSTSNLPLPVMSRFSLRDCVRLQLSTTRRSRHPLLSRVSPPHSVSR